MPRIGRRELATALMLLSAVGALAGCSGRDEKTPLRATTTAALSFDPGLVMISSSSWYLALAETGVRPDQVDLEISGRGVFPMRRLDFGAWTIDGVYPIAEGTLIRCFARHTVDGVVETAEYAWVPYLLGPLVLVDGGSCVPSCGAAVCGNDGCGGSCGTCAAGATCSVQGVCVCTPVCSDATCGQSDGCGGTCPACTPDPPAGDFGSGALGDGPIPASCPSLSGVLTSVAKGTYCVNGDIVVPAGTTLVIPPGTTFIFMGPYHFGDDSTLPDDEHHRSGTIWAIGTAAEPIVFRGATPSTAWYGIVVYHAHDKVHLEYVTIRDAHKSDATVGQRVWRQGGGINSYVTLAGTIVRRCSFINNRARSIAGALYINSQAIWPDEGPIEITNSLFDGNLCDCHSYVSSSQDLCGGGAIRFAHIGGDGEYIKIRNNLFRNNEARLQPSSLGAYGGAIGGFDASVIIGPGNVFQNNSAATKDGAISCGGEENVGLVIDGIDPSVTFSGNSPNNGCGK